MNFLAKSIGIDQRLFVLNWNDVGELLTRNTTDFEI